ncbi:hypothetical protein EVAR_55054_1 [Eumeta japonica]|uniref:Myb-like domain-containing protein n=1 Tax=Eumeta variegata TaxID=151549 RepID=A0A4C1ZR00_EUMVA|nr:hypothetical protein EVAR_55054_1 [Eumeta japonica]
MWCPPTPPQGDGDVYMESWTRALYRPGAAPGDLLPPTARPPPRTPRSPRPRRHLQRVPLAPASLFDRAAPRVRSRLRHHPHVAATHAPHAPHPHPHPALDWTPAEDAVLRRGLRLQRLSAEPPAAHIPNWEWVADLVADVARVYRTARACRDRYEAVCVDDHRAHRKQKKGKPRHDETAPRPPLARIESMREAVERRRRAPKRRYEDPSPHNAKHAALLADLGVDYDKPPSPMEVATRRAERIAKEKLKAGGSATVSQSTAVAASTPPPAQPPAASSAPTPTVASATLHHAPQRIVVAAHSVATLIKGGSVSGVAGASTSGTTQLYRQQALARHQLKVLQQAAPGAAAGSAGEALRTLHLQQLAVGRARTQQAGGAGAGVGGVSAAGAGGPTSRPPHVVVAHLTHPQHLRQASPAPVPTASSTTQPAPAPATHNQNDLTDRQ